MNHQIDETKFTRRQIALIDLLTETQRKNPDQWLSQEEVAKAYPFDPNNCPDGYKFWNRDNDKCTAIWHDIEDIRRSDSFDQIIITKRYRYKLATPKEAKEYAERLRANGIKKIIRAKQIEQTVKQSESISLLADIANSN